MEIMLEVFKIQSITKQFSDKFVLRDFSLDVFPGDKINIAGRSGIGKTTFFRLLLGFEKPDEGFLFFNGKLLTDDTVWEVRKQVSYVSQDLSIGRGTVKSLFAETLHYKANQHLLPLAADDQTRLLERFSLTKSILDKKIEELSGGERQRVAIINALLLKRKIFLLDEVSSSLDPALKEIVLDYFLGKNDFTVLYISHDNYIPSDSNVKTVRLNHPENPSTLHKLTDERSN